MKRIILASASPRRSQLLSRMGIKYEVITSDIDESILEPMDPAELVQALAKIKTEAVARNFLNAGEDTLVIGADTIVVLDNQILGKPKDSQDAEKMLASLSGKAHEVYTGVSILDTKENTNETFVESSKIYMKPMSSEEIKDYILTKEPLDKAGSYGIQGKGGIFVNKIEGDYFTIVGLPISKLYDYLKKYI